MIQYTRIIKEFDISNYLLEYIESWIEYKRERKFTYKERGMRTLLKTIFEKAEKFGDEAVADAIEESISNGYQGIVWERIGKKKNVGGSYMDVVRNRVSKVDSWT